MLNANIGSKIRKLRYNLNLTQEKLGEKADLHYSYIGQVERGDKTPSLKALIKIANALNISLEDLIKEEGFSKEDLINIKLNNINELIKDRKSDELDLIFNLLMEIITFIDRR
jgi:transcriptional regulator with XRE-family HTH domain